MIASQWFQLVRGLWFVHRNQFLLAIVGFFVCLGLTRSAMAFSNVAPEWVAIAGIVLAAPCLFLLTAIFSYCDLRAGIDGPESTFPRFFARLPISSSVYVTTSMLGLVSSIVFWWSAIYFLILPDVVLERISESFRNPLQLLAIPVLLVTSVLSLGYALAITAFERSWIRVLVAPVVCSVPVLVCTLGLQLEWPTRTQVMVQAVICATALASYFLSFHQGRHGVELRIAFPFRTWKTIVRPITLQPFESPESSQFWFEWNRHGIGLMATTIPTVIFAQGVCTACWYLSVEYANKLLVCLSMAGISLVMPVGVGACLGLGILPLKSRFQNYIGMPTFYATRPISDLAIVKKLISMTVLSVALGIVASIGIAVLFGSFSNANGFALRALGRTIDEVGLATVAAIAGLLFAIALIGGFKMFVMNLLLNLTSQMWLWWLNYWSRLLALFGLVIAVQYAIQNQQSFNVSPGWVSAVALVVLALKWGLAWLLIRKLLDLRLCTFRHIRLGLQLWLSMLLALTAIAAFVLRDFPIPVLPILSSFAIFLPINRLFACVLLVHTIRHR